MPIVQPAELWQESGRWAKYEEGQLLKFSDRHERQFCFGPTHEEVITDLARNELRSHRQLPVNYYQIQPKFRDETRPRFGLLRAREFLMKDAYSFHMDQKSLAETYRLMHETYSRILTRMKLDFRPVLADTGSIGGTASMEFHVLAASGEDRIAFSTASDYAANIEMAEALAPGKDSSEPLALEEIATPDMRTIEQVAEFLEVETGKTVKTLIVKGEKAPLVALVLRGDHQLNEVKAEKVAGILAPLTFAPDAEIRAALGCSTGSIGPAGIDIPVIADRSAAALANFVCGANRDDYHFVNVNWERDAKATSVEDLRDVVEGDPSPDGKGTIRFKRGIEVGHIFQLGDHYSRAMNAAVLDENGKSVVMSMGCYGMGVSRLVAAIIEQHHDDNGIIWPTVVAPFQVVIVPINAHKSKDVETTADRIHDDLERLGVEVLIDDREGHRPGVKFADAELMGIPHRIVVGDRGIGKGVIEYTIRATGETKELPIEGIAERLQEQIRREVAD